MLESTLGSHTPASPGLPSTVGEIAGSSDLTLNLNTHKESSLRIRRVHSVFTLSTMRCY